MAPPDSINRERHVPCKCVECVDMADRIETLEELLRESLADPDMNWKTAWADEVREALDA